MVAALGLVIGTKICLDSKKSCVGSCGQTLSQTEARGKKSVTNILFANCLNRSCCNYLSFNGLLRNKNS